MNLEIAKRWETNCKNPASDASHYTAKPIIDALSWLVAEVERLDRLSQFVMQERHETYDRLLARAEKAESDYARLLETHRESVEEVNRLRKVFEAAKGISSGYDWNTGTHAKIYRTQLIDAVDEVVRAIPIKEVE